MFFLLTGDVRYFDAFEKCWSFGKRFMIRHDVGEWSQLTSAQGRPLISDLGNPWKVIYHTCRSMLESEKWLAALAE